MQRIQYEKLPTPEWEAFVSQRQTWEVLLEDTMQFSLKSFGEKVPGTLEKAGPARNY